MAIPITMDTCITRPCFNPYKVVSTFLLLLVFGATKAQQNIDSLEFGIDNIAGFGLAANKIPVTNAPVVNNFPFNVNISSTSNGLHTLFVRTHSITTSGPSQGYWSETNYTYFYKQNNIAASVSNVQKLEYFIDADPGEGNAITINVIPAVQVSGISFNPNIGALANGFHILFIRSLDQNGKWSITNYTYFYKQNNIAASVSNVQKLEYFIDADPGEGNAITINVIPAVQVSGISFNPNIGAMANGFHVLFIRSLDQNGKWSITNYQYFYKQNNVPIPVSIVNKMEYFIDTDPGAGNGNAITLTPATTISGLSFNANISSLAAGFHVIFIRSLDANGKWSITNYAYFSKAGPQTATPVNIVKIEYFIDADPGYFSATDVPVAAAPDIANKNFTANITGLPVGTHYLNTRSLDSRGNWSVNAIAPFNIFSTLPIRLLYFSAQPNGTAVDVTWQTSFEQNLQSFKVEHSIDGSIFTTIGTVAPANDPSGSSYSFKHLTPAEGKNFYRLKIIEADGSFHYSDIKLVNFDLQSLVNIYPDPADDYFTVKTELKNFTLEIIAADGRRIRQFNSFNTGTPVSVSNLPSGLYTIRITTHQTITNTLLIIKH